MSSFLLNRTKDMVNKYRQLLVREAQVGPRPRVSVPLVSLRQDRVYLSSAAGESVGRDGDAGTALPPGRALRVGGGQAPRAQGPRSASSHPGGGPRAPLLLPTK